MQRRRRAVSHLARDSEDLEKFLWWDDFELFVGAVGGSLIGTPAPELCGVTKAIALHVIIGDLDDQFGAKRLPGKIFALAPTALCAWLALYRLYVSPLFPRMIGESAVAVRSQELRELEALFSGETGADADVLKSGRGIIKTKQERADEIVAFLVPAEAGDDAVTIPLVFYLQHGALVRFISTVDELGHNAIETCAFEASEPVGREIRITGGGREMDGRSCGRE